MRKGDLVVLDKCVFPKLHFLNFSKHSVYTVLLVYRYAYYIPTYYLCIARLAKVMCEFLCNWFQQVCVYLHRNKSDISYFALLIIHVTFHFAKVISQLTVLINDDAPLKNAGGPCKNSLRFSSLFGHFLRPESMRWWPKDEFKIVMV